MPDKKTKDSKDQGDTSDEQSPEAQGVSTDQTQGQGTEGAASGAASSSPIQVTLDYQAQQRLRNMLKRKYH